MTNEQTRLRANWSYPTTIWFGPGRIAELGDACLAVGMARPLLVTDPGLAALPIVTDAVAANNAAGLPTGVFADVRANPVATNVADGVAVFHDGQHDGVVGFGGGSGLDAAKSIAFMAGQTRPIWDFEDVEDYWTRADADGIAPIVAVPTTAGTGSEVGRAAVILNEEEHRKVIIFHPRMMPEIVIEDPELTLGLPPHITAATGMDALAHNFEAYCAPGFHPMADGIALESMRLIKEWLPTAVADGTNLTARANMMVAATMGATAFQKGLGAIHALSHPVGALYDTHHGLTNAVFMPYVLDFNRSAIEDRMVRLASFLQLPSPSFDGVMRWVLDLRTEIGIPHTLRDLGVDDARLDELSALAEIDPPAATNPIPVKAPELETMFVNALEGRLTA